MGVSQVALRQVSLEHRRRGLLPLKRGCLFLDTKDPGGKREVQGSSGERARADLRCPHNLSSKSQKPRVSKLWPTTYFRK